MLSAALTGVVTAILAAFGVQPSAGLIAGIFLVMKFVVVMGIFGLVSKWMAKRKAAAEAAPAKAVETEGS